MKISYYAKKRLTDLVINIIMLILLFFTLLPIIWMVYSSLKDSTDIAIGRVSLRRESTDIIKITPEENVLAVLSVSGTVYRYNSKDLTLLSQNKINDWQPPSEPQSALPALAGVDSEIFVKAPYQDQLYLGGPGGRLFKYDLKNKLVITKTRLPEGPLVVRWSNYVDMWKNVNFGLYLRNSIIICGFTMIIAMVLATFAAYSLSRFRFPGSDLFSNAILATQMIPMIMYLIPIYIMFVKFTGLTNIPVKGTYPGIILIYSAWFLPFSIWILRSFFAAIPKELEEAALIDGCSRFRVFWHVALPLAMPGIVATGIYIFLNAWDELMFAWVLTNADTMTIPVGIRLFVGNYQNRFDLMMAAATVATLPVVVIFFLLQKHIVKGLTAGAVKG